MQCIIPAAGYATRLYPLTENFPKPLLEVKGKAILDWLLDDLSACGQVSRYLVVSNHRFVGHFERWAATRQERIEVLDDGTSSNETRLGAVRDLQFALESAGPVEPDESWLVMAGDNLLDFSLGTFLAYAKGKGTSCVMRYHEPTKARLCKSGVLVVDEQERVLEMQEKPAEPKSNWCCPAFYLYKAEDARRIPEAIADGCGTDAPGSLVAWLCGRTPVHAMAMPGARHDIGTLESYRQICESYGGFA